MKEWYISFGQKHRHVINGHILDKDCLALIRAQNRDIMRQKAFKYFKDNFFTDYAKLGENYMEYFPRGIIDFEIYHEHEPVKFDFIDKEEKNGR